MVPDPAVKSPTCAASICVATYERPEQLAKALERLTQLEPPAGGYEIVVVDDGSPSDEVRTVLARAAAASAVPLRWESLPENAGPAVARNRAWRQAGGTWIAFTDDDCAPRRDWLIRLLAAADATGADLVQGRTIPDAQRAHLLSHPLARSLDVSSMDGFFQTCNIAYRRSVLEQVDGFDERYRLIGDDTDLGHRAIEAGATATFAEDAVVEHDVVVRSWRADLRSRRRWADVVAVIARHPDLRRLAWKPYVFRRSHVVPGALLLAAPVMLTRRGRRIWTFALAALVAGDVTRGGNPAGAKANLARRLGDAYEVLVLARASVRHRTVLL